MTTPTTPQVGDAKSTLIEEMRSVARFSLAGATAGGFGGLWLATYRGHPLSFYCVTVSLNCLMISAAISGSERVIAKVKGKSDFLSYGGGGFIGGGFLCAVREGGIRSRGVPAGAVLFGTTSAVGRIAYEAALEY
jgi:hypothetical protein